jgi:hypothetical protein
MTHAAELDLEQLIDDLARQFWKAKSGSAEHEPISALLRNGKARTDPTRRRRQ